VLGLGVGQVESGFTEEVRLLLKFIFFFNVSTGYSLNLHIRDNYYKCNHNLTYYPHCRCAAVGVEHVMIKNSAVSQNERFSFHWQASWDGGEDLLVNLKCSVAACVNKDDNIYGPTYWPRVNIHSPLPLSLRFLLVVFLFLRVCLFLLVVVNYFYGFSSL